MDITAEQSQEYRRRQAHIRDGYKYASDSVARKAAKKAELRLKKARGYPHFNNLGGYQIIDARNIVVAGRDFDLSTYDVVEYCESRIKIHSDEAF